jgi:hypothetical protein
LPDPFGESPAIGGKESLFRDDRTAGPFHGADEIVDVCTNIRWDSDLAENGCSNSGVTPGRGKDQNRRIT